MKILNPDIELKNFYRGIETSDSRTLLLDYDGTLAPFRVNPDEAVPYPGIREILNEIMENARTHLIIITGRWTKDILPLLDLSQQPEIWGTHGLERLKPDGHYETAPMDENALRGLNNAEVLAAEFGFMDRSEEKPGSLALHWRGLDTGRVDQIQNEIKPKWSYIAKKHNLLFKEFDGGLELRMPGRNKGHAVDTILKEKNFKTHAAYLGDDLTDEDAFRSIKGHGLGILVRPEFRETAADVWMKPPEELLKFLQKWI